MIKPTRIIKNPLVLIVPMIIMLILGWQQYTDAKSQINVSQTNILPNAGLDELDSNGFPLGWSLSPASPTVTALSLSGYSSPKLLVLTNSSDSPISNTTLTSPLASVQSSARYLYKGFYKSTVPFDLILRTNYQDGSKKLTIVGHYPANSQWATVSHLFTPDNSAQTVQLTYSFAAKGELQIDDNYLEPSPSDVYQAPLPKLTKNLIPNASLTSSNQLAPDGWTSFTSGSNKLAASMVTTDGKPYLRSTVSAYKDGEAKWQYVPLVVRASQAFQFNVTYRSDAPVDIVAEYVLASGQRQFSTLDTLLPAKDWTTYTGNFQAPANATSLLITVVSRSNGTVDTQDYGLYDTTKSGPANWQKSLLSITFDDGWESAYVNGVPLLDQYGYKATFYINPAALDTADYSFMTSDQVAALQKSGHELASHGYQHLDFTTLDKPSIDFQLSYAYQYFNQVHNEPSVDFATPFGGTDSQVTYYARKYYASLRGTDSGLNTRQNFNPYNLLVLYIGKDTPVSKLADSLAEAQANNDWLILVYHRIDTSTQGEPVISPTQFQQQLDTIKQSGITVLPVTNALRAIEQQP